MKLLLVSIARLKRLLYPFRQIDRWLLARWPMIWAERYHLALSLAVVMSVAAILLGFAQASAAAFTLTERNTIPLEKALAAVPWCVAAAWWWSRARRYDSMPLVRARHGLHYAVFDLAVLAALLLIPLHYSWAFKMGLRTHLATLERTMEDEFRLRTAWDRWWLIATADIPNEDIYEALRALPSGEQAAHQSWFGNADTLARAVIRSDFPQFAPWVTDLSEPDALAKIGINASEVMNPSSPDDPMVLAERAKLEAVLRPLTQQYMQLDVSSYFASTSMRTPSVQEVLSWMRAVSTTNRAFAEFHTSIVRYREYSDFESVESQLWVLFPVSLTLLAIPATTARIYWMTWAVLMTGSVIVLYFLSIFSELFSDRVMTVVYYAVPTTAAVVLLIALTTRRIGKHAAIKMLSVYVPLVLVALPLILVDSVADKWYVGLCLLLLADAVSRLVFNRMRALPDPY